MPIFAFLGVIQHEVPVEQLRRLVDAVRSEAGATCIVICNADGLFANAPRLDSQIGVLFDSGIDLVFLGEHSITRSAARDIVMSDRWPVVRPLNIAETSPGCGVRLLTFGNFSFWAIGLIDSTGKMQIRHPYKVLDEFFLNKKDSHNVLINMHGTDFKYKKALFLHHKKRKHQIFWFNSGAGFAACNPVIVSEHSVFYQSDIGEVSCTNSIDGFSPEAWWKRKFDRLPVDRIPMWGLIYAEYTLLWVDSAGKPEKFIVRDIEV